MMKKIIKRSYIILLLGLFAMIPQSSTAGISIPNVVPNVVVGGPSAVTLKLCEIRKLFVCDNTIIAIVAFSIFLMGVMILNHKLHWGTALTIMAGITIVMESDEFIKMFNTTLDPNQLAQVCKCGGLDPVSEMFEKMKSFLESL